MDGNFRFVFGAVFCLSLAGIGCESVSPLKADQAVGPDRLLVASPRPYKVTAGDTLIGIAMMRGSTAEVVKSLNPKVDFKKLREGQSVVVPERHDDPNRPLVSVEFLLAEVPADYALTTKSMDPEVLSRDDDNDGAHLLSRPKVSTAAGVGAKISSGTRREILQEGGHVTQPVSGLSIIVVPQVSKSMVDYELLITTFEMKGKSHFEGGTGNARFETTETMNVGRTRFKKWKFFELGSLPNGKRQVGAIRFSKP